MSPFHAAGEQWQMMEGSLLMSRKERKRLALLAQVKSGELKLVTAGEVMGVTYRQAKRVWQRSGVEGGCRVSASVARTAQSTAQAGRVTAAGAGALP
jgi:hypothetical protein